MSVPPPGGWQDPAVPPNSGQPYGQQFNPSGYGAQQPPPPGWQQGAWAQQPSPPPNKGNSLKWLLIAVAVLLVIGISVGATLIFTRGDGGGGSTPPSVAAGEFASAGDTGPVAVITDEPTCDAFNGINNGLATVQTRGWGAQRATLGPTSDWTTDQLEQVQAVAQSMRNAADQAVPLAKKTPNRVVRELYGQFIAYGRAYADSVSRYKPSDDGLASANINAGSAIVGICNSIVYGSASRSLGLQSEGAPTASAILTEPNDSRRFISSNDPVCTDWQQVSDKFDAGTTEWQKIDTSTPASLWTPERKALEEAAIPYLQSWATGMETSGRESENPIFEDFAVLAAVYTRAYLSVDDDYMGADSWLNYTAYRINNLIIGGCLASAG